MRKPVGTDLLTLREAVAVVRRLEHITSTTPVRVERWVRHLLVENKLVSDWGALVQGETRLYSAVDVALVRLAWRLHREREVSSWVIRVCLSYLRDELAATWQRGTAASLTVVGVQGVIMPGRSRPAAIHGQACLGWVSLRDVWAGVPAAVRAVRRRSPLVWVHKRQVAPGVLVASRRAMTQWGTT